MPPTRKRKRTDPIVLFARRLRLAIMRAFVTTEEA